MTSSTTSTTQAPRTRRRRERGATLVEYALMLSLVVVSALAVLQSLEDNSAEYLNETGSEIGRPMEGRDALRNRPMDPAPAWVGQP